MAVRYSSYSQLHRPRNRSLTDWTFREAGKKGMNSDPNKALCQWSNALVDRVRYIPQPYRLGFEDWLRQQVGIGQLDPQHLMGRLEKLEPDSQSRLQESIEHVLKFTERTFGSRR